MRWMACALVLAACGGTVEEDGSIPVAAIADAATDRRVAKPYDAGADAHDAFTMPIAFPFHPGEHWIGTYTCPQGLTKLDLAIVSTSGNDVTDAIFDFDWNAVTGSFHMSGKFDPLAHTADFEPGAWIVRPSKDWYTVGMSGTITPSTMTMTYAGDILAQGCTTFSIVRTP